MEFRLDRNALVVTTTTEDARLNRPLAYWRTRPVQERIAAVEFLRRQFIGPGARFSEFCALLRARAVDFVIVGAYALAFHGAPRFTGDLDILIRPTEENAKRLLLAIVDFGFPTLQLSPAQIIEPTRIIEMGIPPVQIHVMSHIDGVSWDEVWQTRETGPLGSDQVAFIGRTAYLRNKRASGRPKDLADIDALQDSGEIDSD